MLSTAEAALLTESESKDDFIARLALYYAELYEGKSVAFADGKMTVYRNGVPSSESLSYVELNLEAYTETDDGYVELFSHISGTPYEDCLTEFGRIKHHYVLSE